MEKPSILHLFTPARNASPFDVNMAIDAGFQHVINYCNVGLDEVVALTQDCIFSRGPKGVARTGIYLGGRDIGLADDMLRAVRQAMSPPFIVSAFADPSGAFTTAAAAIAALERAVIALGGFAGKRLLILGGTGPVGAASAVLARRLGAQVALSSHYSLARASQVTDMLATRYEVHIEPVHATESNRGALLTQYEILLGAAAAGVEVASLADIAGAKALLAAADLNAVSPAGIAGIGVQDDRVPLPASKAVGIGALAVGQIKYQTQRILFQRMLEGKSLFLDFQDAFETARAYCKEQAKK